MTNLTETSTYDANISVPDDGEEITAVAAGAGRGPVRPSLQSLANRAKYLKDRIAAVLNGTLSFRALSIDGSAGGSAATPPAGTIQLTSDYGAAAHAEGVLTLRMIPFAVVGFAGGAASGFTASSSDNIASCTRNSAGNYTVVTLTCPAAHAGLGDGTEIFTYAQVTPRFTGPYFCDVRVFKTTVAGTARLRAEVRTWNPGSAATDAPFSLTLGA